MEKIQINSFYSIFKGYNIKDINEVLTKLSDLEIVFLVKFFCIDLKGKVEIDNELDYKKYEEIVSKMKLMLNKKKVKNIYEIFSNYSRNEIFNAFNRLPSNDRILINKYYGPNLDDVNLDDVDSNTMFRLDNIIYNHFRKILENEMYVNSKNNMKSKCKVKTVMEMFSNYSQADIMNAFKCLKVSDQDLLIKAFGINLDTFVNYYEMSKKERLKLSQIKQKMKKIIVDPNSQRSTMKSKEDNLPLLTNSSVYDMLNKVKYKSLSRDAEISFIKKSKLSFYYEVSDKKQITYLKYYMEVLPKFKKKYEEASYDEREKLLEKAIEDSLIWRNKFLENNLRLVVSIAKRYINKYSFEDLVIEGNFGLIRALQKFDVTKGNKFSTYATQWINHSITRFISNYSRIVRIPVHMGERLYLLKRKREEFELENHRVPNMKELSEITNLNLKAINDLIEYEAQLEYPVSLGGTIKSDSSFEIENFVIVHDDSYDKTDDNIYYSEFIKILNNSNLDTRTLEILKMHYGLYDGISKTLEDIEEHFGITRERVRQIELKGLKKLKENVELTKFYNDDKACFINKKTDESSRAQKLEKLKKIISNMNLSSEEVKIINMFFIDNLSLKEISNLVGISMSEVNEIKEKVYKLF